MCRVVLVGLVVVVVAACDRLPDPAPEDVCNDQAWDECIHIAERECGLSSYASEAELQDCEPFVACDDVAFVDCMEEKAR